MSLDLLTPPTTEPITLDEAKAQCRVTSADEDALLTALIVAARQTCENELHRALISQVWVKTLDTFPDAVKLAYPPVLTVDAVEYRESVAGVWTTLSTVAYSVDVSTVPGYVVPAYGYTWPDVYPEINAVKVTFSCGYGPTAATVPEAVKHWIKLHVAHYFKNREASIETTGMIALPFLGGLLDRYRVFYL